MSTAGSAGRDTRLFKVCDPWYGQKGAPFERVFRPAFTSGIASVVRDEYGNGRDHLKGSDPGGVKPPTAAQLAANAAHAGTISPHFGTANETRKSVIAWRQRDTEVINALGYGKGARALDVAQTTWGSVGYGPISRVLCFACT